MPARQRGDQYSVVVALYKFVTLEPDLVIDIQLMKSTRSKAGRTMFLKRYSDASY